MPSEGACSGGLQTNITLGAKVALGWGDPSLLGAAVLAGPARQHVAETAIAHCMRVR